ncbi:MAG: hypothetical protein R2771_11555 [Saprospiraceae bacterium]
MKPALIFKLVFILPILLFVDYLIMVLLGCATCLFGFDDNFNCGNYCIIGKSILFISVVVYLLIVYPDIRDMIKARKHGATTEG